MMESSLSRVDIDRGPDADVVIDDWYRVPLDLDCFRGHFPGFAVLPAILQLYDIVLPAVMERCPELGAVTRIVVLKFRRPVRPGDVLRLRATVKRRNGSVRFTLSRDSEPCASGAFDCRVFCANSEAD